MSFFCLVCLVSVFRLLLHCVRLCTHLLKANNMPVVIILPTCSYSFFFSSFLPSLILDICIYVYDRWTYTRKMITSAWKMRTSNNLGWCWRRRHRRRRRLYVIFFFSLCIAFINMHKCNLDRSLTNEQYTYRQVYTCQLINYQTSKTKAKRRKMIRTTDELITTS
jgi:dolichyl-phosphate-mannose--protein O-mannosyl transferase